MHVFLGFIAWLGGAAFICALIYLAGWLLRGGR